MHNFFSKHGDSGCKFIGYYKFLIVVQYMNRNSLPRASSELWDSLRRFYKLLINEDASLPLD
jgi:hypothetical protein